LTQNEMKLCSFRPYLLSQEQQGFIVKSKDYVNTPVQV